jgi:peptidoglycan lytic transglycosylase
MRPQLNGRARRAAAALGAATLAAGAWGGAASASSTVSKRGASARAGRPARAGHGRHRHRRHVRRSHRRPVRLHALMLHRDILVGGDVAFIGETRPARARRVVGVEELRGSRWVGVARAVTDGDGHFLARFFPRELGRMRLRVKLVGGSGSGTTVLGPAVTVFHAVQASWYDLGGRTACGETLDAGTLGVANRTLPCGTLVTLRYDGRTVRVPVIDRGPFVAGRDYDLTYATKLALGMGDVSEIWASA